MRYLSPEEIGKEEKTEIILKENPNRWVMFPIEYHGFWELYKEIENNFWAAENYRYSDDREAAGKLDPEIRSSLVRLLYYQTKLDRCDSARPAMVTLKMLSDVQIPEMRAFYGFQVSYENIHSEVFGSMSLVVTGVCDPNTGREKMEWLSNKIAQAECFYIKVIIQCISKFVFRSSYAILRAYMEKEKLMPTFVEAMKMVDKDIGIHLKFAASTLEHLKLRLTREYIVAILEEALQLEMDFCKKVLSLDRMGIREEHLSDYLKNQANQILSICGQAENYRPEHRLDWLDLVTLDLKVSVKVSKPLQPTPIPIPEVGVGAITFDEDF